MSVRSFVLCFAVFGCAGQATGSPADNHGRDGGLPMGFGPDSAATFEAGPAPSQDASYPPDTWSMDATIGDAAAMTRDDGGVVGHDATPPGEDSAAGAQPLAPVGFPEPCADSTHGVAQETLRSSVDGHDIAYRIYLPPGYECSSERYPLSLVLHGLGGNGELIDAFASSLEAAMHANAVGPMILVAPDDYPSSMWADGRDGSFAETETIQELIPHVDATFRTMADARVRTVQGFSMGGFGAMLYGTKFPELFAAALSYDGALHNWQTLRSNRRSIARETFGNDSRYFDMFSPFAQATGNADALRASTRLFIRVGALGEYNQRFHEHLNSLMIPSDFGLTSCGHQVSCVLSQSGQAGWRFVRMHQEAAL